MRCFPRRASLFRSLRATFVCSVLLILSFHQPIHHQTAAAQPSTIVVTSAASYDANALAPGAIATAFGAALATQVSFSSTVPLPTSLAGTSVSVRDSAGSQRLAGLFYVSPNQINFLIPEATALGAAVITVTAGDGKVSAGTFDIKIVAPAIFTTNADGQGVPAAAILRVKSDGRQIFENVAQFDAASARWRTVPIDLSPAGDQVFLVLFLSGTARAADPNNDGNRNESARLLLGGVETTPLFLGPQGSFVGLDQMNLLLPRTLIGSGRINLAISGSGLTSNSVELEFAGSAGTAPPTVSGFNTVQALAGQAIEIQGNSFASNAADNLVRIGGIEAQVSAVTSGRLNVIVPNGAETGVVTVRTPQGEGRSNDNLRIRTSLSGLVENTERAPLKDVTVRVRQGSVTTSSSGAFVLPDPVGTALGAIVEVDGSRLPVNPPFGKVSFLLPFSPNRDNQVARPITLQQSYGTSTQVGGQGLQQNNLSETMLTTAVVEAPTQPQPTQVTLSFPAGTRFQFPDGATRGALTLTLVEKSRTPVALPNGVFSSTIVQITPFGTKFTPGGTFTFPNNDGFAANAAVRLFRLDQTADSATLGRFIDAGAATVTADGQRIVTASGAVTEATYYFVSLARNSTTVVGRVLDSDRGPARRVLVRARGQEDFTDGNGGFVLRNVPVGSSNDAITVEASLVRPNFRIDRTESRSLTAVAGGVTDAATLVLPAANSNQPPYVLIPPSLDIVAGTTAEISFVADDPDSDQPVQVNFNGPTFATLLTNRRTIRLSPSANDIGLFALTLTVTDNAGSGFALIVRGSVVRGVTPTNGTVTGVVRNASNGQPLAGATVAIANTSLTTSSATNGAYTINDVPAGAHTLTAAATGFSATQLAITVVAGQSLTQNISLSPTLVTGQLRITVNWTKDTANAPDDLDARLFGPLGNNQCFHVHFDNTGSLTAPPFAALEVDNIELAGHPPTETIRIAQRTPGLYRFFIHDYENEYPDGISRSRATVQVFDSNGLLRTYVAPTGTGEYWHVFELNGQTGVFTDINQLASAPPAFTCGSGGTSGVTVLDHRTAADPIPANCVAPTLKPAFLTTDPLVWQWTLINGVVSGDVMRWEFIQPNGSVYNTQTYTWPQSGNFCIWRGIQIANSNAASLPGNWRARVYYKDALIVTDNFTIGTSALTENFARQRVKKTRLAPH